MLLVESFYEQKEDFFASFPAYVSVSAAEFYRDIFPPGSFEERVGFQETYEKTNKGNGFIVYTTEYDKKHTRIVFDDHKELFELLDNPCAFMSPISYFGRNRTSANARQLYALTFDLDEVGFEEIDLLINFWVYQKRIPMPTYIVNSGGGVHLYFVFSEPMPMTPKNQKMMKQFKYYFTTVVWNGDTSRLKDRQFQGLNQGFRLVGSFTKNGERVKAYRTGEKIDIENLLNFAPKELGLHYQEYRFESRLTLEQAKKKYPEWYHQRIELKRQKTNWTCKRDLYDWWKRRAGEAEHHHRYFYIMALAVYAVKCGIEFDELKKDAYSFKEILNRKSPENPFTDDDIKSALEMHQECFRTFPRDEISKLTAIDIKANKRNGRKQSVHLRIARAIQQIQDEENGTKWNGRKSAEGAVLDYIRSTAEPSCRDFCEKTGLKKSVYYKYKPKN